MPKRIFEIKKNFCKILKYILHFFFLCVIITSMKEKKFILMSENIVPF